MRQRFLSACLLPAILLYAACSFNTPAVVQAKRQRIYSYNRQGVLTERLAAFILLDDRDGRNDYKNLTLREDSTGLEWMIHRENTVFLQEAGYGAQVQWVGSNKFSYPRRLFPEGTYTLTAADLGGNTSKTTFSLAAPYTPKELPFDFTLQDEQWTLSIKDRNVCSSFSLIMLSADLQPLTVYRIALNNTEQHSDSLAALKDKPADARYVQCFGENSDQSFGFLSKPIALPF
ncbi:MAG: hypothetical protein ACTTI6_05225 [Treponema sp.]|uniref:hypothetical protein n=1 Tax=Treponema sp. TaxID=166 RepID=UPI003FA26525